MDHRSAQLMEDLVLESKSNSKPNFNSPAKGSKDKNVKPVVPFLPRKLKVELQTLRLSDESEKQLYDTLKQIYGSSFKLYDASEFTNKKSSLGKQYWMERGNLVIKGIVDYSAKDNTPKTHDQITRQFATCRLETYSFHSSHCAEALIHTNGDMGKALEILFSKYYGVENESRDIPYLDSLDTKELLERKREEKEALESIYADAFCEKIKNQIWMVQLNLDYLVNAKKDNAIPKKEKKPEKEICRLFLHKKCRFGIKCRFLHQQPEPPKVVSRIEPAFTLEIRFPQDCKYPYEPPYLYFYKNDGTYPKIKCLRIARRLYEEARQLATDGTPSIFSLISLLENEFDIKTYLEENAEQFLDQNESLFPQSSVNDDDADVSTHYKMGSTSKTKRDKISLEEITREDDIIQKKFKEKQSNPRYLRMKESRKKLPAWSRMNEITETIREHQITIISGETGCGKSTQVAQFLLDTWIVNRSDNKEHVNIVCTQPRRISAIGVAERVAAERIEHVGNTVGYQIRLENKMSNSTRLTFCTTGILLQRLTANPDLDGVTHVIVDEVHERSAESDLLLLLLKRVMMKRSDLKIILMSATLNTDIFSSYFGACPILSIPGKTFPVKQIFLEDILEKTNYILEENSTFTRRIKGGWEQLNLELETADTMGLAGSTPKDSILDENLTLTQLIARYQKYSKQTHKSLYVMDHEKINYDLIENIIEWLVLDDHDYPKTGSILVFLPGFAEIIALRDQLNDNKNLSSRTGKFVIIPLHSSLTNEEQSLVFKTFQDGVRKIVLSTNLAETSITIDDCVFVIDTGKMKETRFNSSQNIESLETCWISRANALQRKGRAGRVMPGVCIHLYTSYRYKYHFSAQPVPEILRIPLEPLLLRIKMMHKAKRIDLHNILGKMLEPPKTDSISTAIKSLQDIGAFDAEHMLTPLGHHLAMLPVNVRIGKLILYGAIFCCLDSALTIAACLSYKNPFTVPFEKRREVDAKKEFFTANSDQLTILKAYKKWLEACSHSAYAGRVFASENYLSVRILQTLADVKYQLLELLVSIGFVPVNLPRRQTNTDKILDITGFGLNTNNENYKLLQGLLCAALYPNVVKVYTPEKSFQVQSAGAIPVQPKPEELRFQTKHDGFVNIHPSSVNFHVGHFSSPYLVYQEKIKTSKIFIREVSMIPILSLVLFSGFELNIELHDGIFIVSLEGGWIMFSVESHRIAQLLQLIRTELAKLLEKKMQEPLLNLLNNQNGKKVINTIVNIVTKE
ncbi:hypothetical protein KPH14_004791 [Odynerus spinipes]|uniref:Putative ATP-dependent RNA helicase DHX57 n=1 Tax=Odynerus spinipes TaxID=1348599 RepID=A0AAD9RNK7_9HYME|nr:hypothetical protein KPH14_004791 [Odynerus spinipes]